jgi:hypothetical protein
VIEPETSNLTAAATLSIELTIVPALRIVTGAMPSTLIAFSKGVVIDVFASIRYEVSVDSVKPNVVEGSVVVAIADNAGLSRTAPHSGRNTMPFEDCQPTPIFYSHIELLCGHIASSLESLEERTQFEI